MSPHDYSDGMIPDGEILRQARLHRRAGRQEDEQNWLSRLTAYKRSDIQALQRRKTDRVFWNALDECLDFAALWPGLVIGNFRRILDMRCPDVGVTESGDRERRADEI